VESTGIIQGLLWRIVPSKWLDYDLSTKLMQLMPVPPGGRQITRNTDELKLEAVNQINLKKKVTIRT